MVEKKNDRASIFIPFDAVKGLKEALKEKERIIAQDIFLTDDLANELNNTLFELEKGMMIKVIHYEQGTFIETTGILTKINIELRFIVVVKQKIILDNIRKIEIL